MDAYTDQRPSFDRSRPTTGRLDPIGHRDRRNRDHPVDRYQAEAEVLEVEAEAEAEVQLEVLEVVSRDGQSLQRYMKAIMIEAPCLACWQFGV